MSFGVVEAADIAPFFPLANDPVLLSGEGCCKDKAGCVALRPTGVGRHQSAVGGCFSLTDKLDR